MIHLSCSLLVSHYVHKPLLPGGHAHLASWFHSLPTHSMEVKETDIAPSYSPLLFIHNPLAMPASKRMHFFFSSTIFHHELYYKYNSDRKPQFIFTSKSNVLCQCSCQHMFISLNSNEAGLRSVGRGNKDDTEGEHQWLRTPAHGTKAEHSRADCLSDRRTEIFCTLSRTGPRPNWRW